jgi:hypothetical protein
VLVLAWRPVGSATAAKLQFPFVEVLLKRVPFFLSRFAIFGLRANASAIIEVCAVGAYYLVREYRKVVLRRL